MGDSVPGKTARNLTVFCDICAETKEYKEVHGYCEDCKEYLCASCFEYHLKPKPSRHHKILKLDDMPRDVIALNEREDKQFDFDAGMTEICGEHPNEKLNFYCPVHENLFCGACIALKHKNCGNIDYIPDAASGETKSEAFKQVELMTIDILSHSEKCKLQLSHVAEANEKHTNMTIEQIDSFRETLIDSLNKREEEVTLKVNGHNQQIIEDISHFAEQCDAVESEVKVMQEKMSLLKVNKQHGQLYLLTRKCSAKLESLCEQLPRTEDLCNLATIHFSPNTKLADILNEPNVFGDFEDINLNEIGVNKSDLSLCGSEESKTGDESTTTKPKETSKSTIPKSKDSSLLYLATSPDKTPFTSKKLHSSVNIDVKMFSGENKPWITGITNINPGEQQHAVALFNSQSIALVDSRQKRVIAEKKLHSGPWDVTSVKAGELIATLPYKSKLVFIKVNSIRGLPSGSVEMKISKSIDVTGDCYSITNDEENIYVSFQNPPKLEVLTLDGTVIRKIDTDADGNQMFMEPQYVACNSSLKLLYVSDWHTDVVICLTTEGHVKKTFKDESLKAPTGIDVDQSGNVFVAGYNSNNILQLSPTFRKRALALDRRDGVIWPQALAFSSKYNKFCIGFRNNDVMKVFRVK